MRNFREMFGREPRMIPFDPATGKEKERLEQSVLSILDHEWNGIDEFYGFADHMTDLLGGIGNESGLRESRALSLITGDTVAFKTKRYQNPRDSVSLMVTADIRGRRQFEEATILTHREITARREPSSLHRDSRDPWVEQGPLLSTTWIYPKGHPVEQMLYIDEFLGERPFFYQGIVERQLEYVPPEQLRTNFCTVVYSSYDIQQR